MLSGYKDSPAHATLINGTIALDYVKLDSVRRRNQVESSLDSRITAVCGMLWQNHQLVAAAVLAIGRNGRNPPSNTQLSIPTPE
jgi:hypothetical protein